VDFTGDVVADVVVGAGVWEGVADVVAAIAISSPFPRPDATVLIHRW
jgi:hypothetical protein